jgi:RecA-family ATPase
MATPAEKPVTGADREAALASRAAVEAPQKPFDAKAGYRAHDRAVAIGNGTAAQFSAAVNPAELAGKPIPFRRWLVDGWIPFLAVTGIYGDGGTGKTLIGQGLQTSCAAGLPWLGLPTSRCRSFGLYCEDDNDELHRRQADINRALGLDFAELEPMRWWSRQGEDNILMHFHGAGRGTLTSLYYEFIDRCLDHLASLAIIDTAADTFGGNENIRPEVRQFVGHALGGIARAIHGAVVLVAHPSRTGLASGEGDGGNTAWNNTFRSRLYLSHLKAEDGTTDTDQRVLSRKKASYSRAGDSIELRWDDGYFQVEHAATGINATVRNHEADRAFLAALDKMTAQGINLSASPAARNYAPTVILKQRMAGSFKRQEVADAMQRVFNDGRIVSEQYGRPGREMAKISVVTPLTVGHTSAND